MRGLLGLLSGEYFAPECSLLLHLSILENFIEGDALMAT